jgi:hypothetical protein
MLLLMPSLLLELASSPEFLLAMPPPILGVLVAFLRALEPLLDYLPMTFFTTLPLLLYFASPFLKFFVRLFWL